MVPHRVPDDSRTRFAEDGFAVMPGFLDSDELSSLLRELDRLLIEVVPRMSPEHVYAERGPRDEADDPTSLKQLQLLQEQDPYFEELLHRSRFRDVAETVLGEPVRGKNLQYFCKAAGRGLATPPHQDGHYFMIEPPSAVTLWLALDEVDQSTGCVFYVQGSHREGLRSHAASGTLGFSQHIPDYQSGDRERACVCQPGDLLAHHCWTIHRAGANENPARARRALGMIYYGESAREDRSAHHAYQRSLTENLRRQGRI